MKENKAVSPEKAEPVVRGRLITIEEAAEMTSLGKDWFYQNMKNGTLPFPWYRLTVGKRFMDSWDIECWMKLRKVPAASLPGDLEEVL